MSAAGNTTLDLRGLLCPQPIIDLAREMGKIDVGEDIVILSDDAAFPLDLRAWCAGTGHELLDLSSAGHEHRAEEKRANCTQGNGDRAHTDLLLPLHQGSTGCCL